MLKGDAGPAVAWAKQNLSRLDGGADSETGPAYFDTDLEDRVRKLQLAYGIQADGIIGPETLFALSALDESGRRPSVRRSWPCAVGEVCCR